jgi:cytochrome c
MREERATRFEKEGVTFQGDAVRGQIWKKALKQHDYFLYFCGMYHSNSLSMSTARMIAKAQKCLVMLPLGCALFFAAPVQHLQPMPVAATDGPDIPVEIAALLSKYTCSTCHQYSTKLVGPSWKEIAAQKYTKKHIVELVYKPSPNNWPTYPPMLAQTNVPKSDLNKIAAWLVKVKV